MSKKTIEMKVPFFQVPNEIFEIGLNKFELLVYLYLARCANNKEVAYPSLNTISKKIGISRSSTQRAINNLEQKKLIYKEQHKTKNNRYYNNKYYVEVNIEKGMFSENTPIVSENTGVCSDTVTKKNYIKKNYKKTLTSSIEDDEYILFSDLYNDIVKWTNKQLDTGRSKISKSNYYKALDVLNSIEYDKLLVYAEDYKHNKQQGKSVENFIHYLYRYVDGLYYEIN